MPTIPPPLKEHKKRHIYKLKKKKNSKKKSVDNLNTRIDTNLEKETM